MSEEALKAFDREDNRIQKFNDWLNANEPNLIEDWLEYVDDTINKIKFDIIESKRIFNKGLTLQWLWENRKVITTDDIPDWWLANKYADSFEPPED